MFKESANFSFANMQVGQGENVAKKLVGTGHVDGQDGVMLNDGKREGLREEGFVEGIALRDGEMVEEVESDGESMDDGEGSEEVDVEGEGRFGMRMDILKVPASPATIPWTAGGFLDYHAFRLLKNNVVPLANEAEQKLRDEGFGDMAVLPDFLICRILVHYLMIESDSPVCEVKNLMLTSKALYQIGRWDLMYRWLTVDFTGGDFDYDRSWRQTFANAYIKKQWEVKCIAEGTIGAPCAYVNVSEHPVVNGLCIFH